MDPRQMLFAEMLRNNQRQGQEQTSIESFYTPQQQQLHTLGVLGQVSGDPTLGQAGQSIMQSVDKNRQQEILKNYYDQQSEQWRKNYELKVMEAAAKANAPPEFLKLTDSARGFMQSSSGTLGALDRLKSQFKPEYTQLLSGSIGGEKFSPEGFTGPLEELPLWLRNQGLSGVLSEENRKKVEEAARWWAEFEMSVTLPMRHELFGATLTANEQNSFNKALSVSPKLTADAIRNRMDRMQFSLASGMKKFTGSLLGEGYNPAAINPFFGGEGLPNLNVPEASLEDNYYSEGGVFEPIESSAPPQKGGAARKRRRENIFGFDVEVESMD